MTRTSVLNFHTLWAPGNSIRQAENPVTTGTLPAVAGPFIRPPPVNLERGGEKNGSGAFQPVSGNKLRKLAECLEHTPISIYTCY